MYFRFYYQLLEYLSLESKKIETLGVTASVHKILSNAKVRYDVVLLFDPRDLLAKMFSGRGSFYEHIP